MIDYLVGTYVFFDVGISSAVGSWGLQEEEY